MQMTATWQFPTIIWHTEGKKKKKKEGSQLTENSCLAFFYQPKKLTRGVCSQYVGKRSLFSHLDASIGRDGPPPRLVSGCCRGLFTRQGFPIFLNEIHALFKMTICLFILWVFIPRTIPLMEMMEIFHILLALPLLFYFPIKCQDIVSIWSLENSFQSQNFVLSARKTQPPFIAPSY